VEETQGGKAMRALKPMHMDTDGDQIALLFEDEKGEQYEAKLTTIDVVTLASSLPGLIERAVSSPNARSPQMLGMNFVQLLENEETVWLRISIGDHGVFHDYGVPKNTTLADDLRFLADRVASRQEAKAIHSPPDSLKGKH
jgi:hypothetical protein